MTDFIYLFAWLMLNIAAPALVPMARLPLLALSRRFKGRTRELLHRSIREGQLCWTAIALSDACRRA